MSPFERYQEQLDCPGFYPDAAQAAAVEALQSLYATLLSAGNAPAGLFTRWFRRTGTVPGIYIQGGVGRG